MLEVEITQADEGTVLRQFLKDRLQLSSRYIKKLTQEKRFLLINGRPVTVRYRLQAGDRFCLKFPEETRSESLLAEDLPLDVVYEDDWLLVLYKDAGIPSIPSLEHPRGTIANALLGYYQAKELPYTVHIVTRLDKGTSGLMLVAKHHLSHSRLSQAQRQGRIERYYEALVEGRVERNRGKIDRPIRRKQSSIIEREVGPGGQEAITYFNVVRRYRHYTHVQLRLETGRTHQIRVHFSSLGHPVVGDTLYGAREGVLAHHALHCNSLKFPHPYTGQPLSFYAKAPASWNQLL